MRITPADLAGARAPTIHVVNRMAPGGIETLVLDLLKHEDPAAPIYVFSLEGTVDELCANWPALNRFRDRLVAFSAPPGRRFGTIRPLARAMKCLGAQDVFVHHIGPLVYAGAASRLTCVKRLVHVEHDAWHYDTKPGHVRLLRWSERLLRPHHFAVSQPIAARLRALLAKPGITRGIAPGITVVPPGIDTLAFAPGDRDAARNSIGISADVVLIGTAGRLTAVKGHRHLIEALAALDDNVQAAIVGDGELRGQLEAAAASAGVAHRIHFLGHRDDVAAIYPAFDVFCLPSLNEGLPRVVMEAQSAGIPVVASDVGAVGDAVSPVTGRLVAPGKPHELAAALKQSLSDEPASDASRAFVMANYDFAITKRHYDLSASVRDIVRSSSSMRRGYNA